MTHGESPSPGVVSTWASSPVPPLVIRPAPFIIGGRGRPRGSLRLYPQEETMPSNLRRAVFTLFAALLLAPALVQAQAQRLTVEVFPDLTYGKGGDTDLKLDLAVPKDADGPFPVLVGIHGGAWRGGQRKDLSKTIEAFAGR